MNVVAVIACPWRCVKDPADGARRAARFVEQRVGVRRGPVFGWHPNVLVLPLMTRSFRRRMLISTRAGRRAVADMLRYTTPLTGTDEGVSLSCRSPFCQCSLPAPASTIVFTDIVGSTALSALVGDREWRRMLDRHVKEITELTSERGGHVRTMLGDGLLIEFTDPSSAVQCAVTAVCQTCSDGLAIRAGIHRGHVERLQGSPIGLAVAIAARTCSHAGEAEVIVTQAVCDTVELSTVEFVDVGRHRLRGVPDRQQLYRASAP